MGDEIMYNEYKVYRGTAFVTDEEGVLSQFKSDRVEDKLKLANEREILTDKLEQSVKKYQECKDKTTALNFAKLISKYLIYYGMTILGTGFLFGGTFMIDPVLDPDILCMVSRGFLFTITLLNAKGEFTRFLQDTQERDGLALVIKFLNEEIAKVDQKIQKVWTVKNALSVDTEIVSLKQYNDLYEERMTKRMDRICSLGAIKDELLKCLDSGGALERELINSGVFKEDLSRGRRYIMEMKKKQETSQN